MKIYWYFLRMETTYGTNPTYATWENSSPTPPTRPTLGKVLIIICYYILLKF